METRPQYCVDEQLCSLKKCFVDSALQVGFFLNGDGQGWKAIQHNFCVTADLGGIPEQKDRDVTTGICEMPRSHHSVASIVALAAQHHDAPALGQLTQDETRNGVPGALHQFHRGDPETLAGDPIGTSHLVSGQYLHSSS